jgi:hypothetical protein
VIKLISFASSNYFKSAKALLHLGIERGFTSLQIFQPDDFIYLKKDITSVQSPFIDWKQRGSGYWRWKPHIIHKALSQSTLDSWVLYVDAGILLNINAKDLLLLLHQKENCASVHLWQNKKIEPIAHWTHPFVIEKLGLDPSQSVSPMLYSGMIAVKNDERGRDFIVKWRDLCDVDTFLFPELLNLSSNLPNFYVWHRHDQSLLSIVATQNPLCVDIHSLDETSLRPIFNLHRKSNKRYLLVMITLGVKRFLWHKIVDFLPTSFRKRVRILLTKRKKTINSEELNRHKEFF